MNQDTPLECGADTLSSEPEPSQLSQAGARFVLNHIVTKMTGCLMTAGMTGLGLTWEHFLLWAPLDRMLGRRAV